MMIDESNENEASYEGGFSHHNMAKTSIVVDSEMVDEEVGYDKAAYR